MSAGSYLCVACWRQLEPREAPPHCQLCDAETQTEGGDLLADPNRGRQGGGSPLGGFLFEGGGRGDRCSRHPEARARRFCPCGGELTEHNLLGWPPIGLGFGGNHGAGKTIMILSSLGKLRERAGRPGQLHLVGVGQTEMEFAGMRKRLLAGEKPRTTALEDEIHRAGGDTGDPRNFCWEVSKNGKRGTDDLLGLVAVYDVAGDIRSHPQYLELWERYLKLCTSFVFLMDGQRIASDLGLEGTDAWAETPRAGDQGALDTDWLRDLHRRVGGAHTEGMRLAMVISKADLLWEEERWAELHPRAETTPEARQTLIEDLLGESGRGGLVGWARAEFEEVRLFAASSLGFRPASGHVEDGKLIQRPDPIGVVEPLLWLLEETDG